MSEKIARRKWYFINVIVSKTTAQKVFSEDSHVMQGQTIAWTVLRFYWKLIHFGPEYSFIHLKVY